MKVTCTRELRTAYEMLFDLEERRAELNADPATSFDRKQRIIERIVDLKHAIRNYTHRNESRYAIHNNFDGCIVVIPMPAYFETEEDVEEYFRETQYIPIRYSAYDCTGRQFTSWHRVLRRAGRWYLYHAISVDC